jgi:hypothetical protein
MKKLRRLAKAIVKAYPTVCMFDVESALANYRISRDIEQRDWENTRAFFQRVIHGSVKDRHLR